MSSFTFKVVEIWSFEINTYKIVAEYIPDKIFFITSKRLHFKNQFSLCGVNGIVNDNFFPYSINLKKQMNKF